MTNISNILDFSTVFQVYIHPPPPHLFSLRLISSQLQSPTFKDLDFLEHHPTGIELETETYEAFEKTLRRDVRVLESFKIMDYSLLLGIHNLDQYERDKHKR